jgi:hypothetical protein
MLPLESRVLDHPSLRTLGLRVFGAVSQQPPAQHAGNVAIAHCRAHSLLAKDQQEQPQALSNADHAKAA